jgi:hypothetical protein
MLFGQHRPARSLLFSEMDRHSFLAGVDAALIGTYMYRLLLVSHSAEYGCKALGNLCRQAVFVIAAKLL